MGEAPNFSGTYPGAGERLGPAWRAVWALLADGEWHRTPDLKVASDVVLPITIKNLLREAHRAGVLEHRLVPHAKYGSMGEYRRVRSVDGPLGSH